MTYDEKAVRKAIRAKIAEFKQAMLGRTSCSDMGGRKWRIEYAVLSWHETDAKWGEAGWDYYHSCDSQRELLSSVQYALTKNHAPEKLAVTAELLCDGSVNASFIATLDGNEYRK